MKTDLKDEAQDGFLVVRDLGSEGALEAPHIGDPKVHHPSLSLRNRPNLVRFPG